jgi:hypothetical protein
VETLAICSLEGQAEAVTTWVPRRSQGGLRVALLPLPTRVGEILPAVPSTTRAVVGIVPATIAVIFGVLILLAGFFAGPARQRYALRAARCSFEVAEWLAGAQSHTSSPDFKDKNQSSARGGNQ